MSPSGCTAAARCFAECLADLQVFDNTNHGNRGEKRLCLQGYNAAIIAYGQTGTGKTYTMEGAQHGPERGIIPRAVEDVFAYIENDTAPGSKYLVRASYLQIYNEVPNQICQHCLCLRPIC
jgi:hypothetical protein